MKTRFLALLLFLPLGLSAQLLVDEDFTDGQFDDFGAGENGENWGFYGSGDVGFYPPNNRDFPLSVARKPSGGGSAWSGVSWHMEVDTNNDGNGDRHRYHSIHKEHEVVLLRFEAFSDFAHKIEFAGVEVAMLEYRSSLCGSPDFCHDLSFETKQTFYSRPQDPQIDIETNVENTQPNNLNNKGIANAHYQGRTQQKHLGDIYENFVIWRNRHGEGRTNVEQWGELNYGDLEIDTPMVAMLAPEDTLSRFSEVQVALFRNDSNFDLLRDGISPSEAQIGLLNVRVGITRRADFNLDYRVDSADAALLAANLGRSDSTTLTRGDASNDGAIDYRDAAYLAALWSEPQLQMEASATYNSSDGSLSLSASGVSWLSISLRNGGQLKPDNLNWGPLAPTISHSNTEEIVAFTPGSFQGQSLNLGSILPPGLSPSDIEIRINRKGSMHPEGILLPADGSLVTDLPRQATEAQLRLFPNPAGERLQVEGSKTYLRLQVLDRSGRILREIRPSSQRVAFDLGGLPSGSYLLRAIDQEGTSVRRFQVSH